MNLCNRCKQADIFFNTFVNINKYLDHEEHDPFAPDDDDQQKVRVYITYIYRDAAASGRMA